MDPLFRGIELENRPRFEISYPDQKLVNEHRNQSSPFHENCIGGGRLVFDQPFSNGSDFSSFEEIEDDCDFSDSVLRYIDQILMEEDIEDKTHMLQESLDLQAKESFYEVLGKKYPPSPQQDYGVVSHECGDDNHCVNCLNSTTSSSDGSGYLIDIVDPSWLNTRTDHALYVTDFVGPCRASKPSISSSIFLDGFSDSPVSPLQIHDMYSESQLVWRFGRGVDEANKFVPAGNNLLVNGGLAAQDPNEEEIEVRNAVLRGKKNRNLDTDLEEERSSKLPAVYAESDSDVPMEEFDDVLLHTMGERGKSFAAYREVLQNETGKGTQQNGQIKRPSGRRDRTKKQNKKKEVIDLRTLLITCAQAVAADDRRTSNDLLKQIRQHASPYGEGNQRLAHYFADGLEARLAGTGSQIHKALISKKTIASNYLKAYYTYLILSLQEDLKFHLKQDNHEQVIEGNESSCHRFWHYVRLPISDLDPTYS